MFPPHPVFHFSLSTPGRMAGRGQFLRPDWAFAQDLWLRSAEVEDGAGLGEVGAGPASIRRGMRPSSWSSTDAAVTQGGWPLRLALEEARGPTRRARARRKGCAGRRTPTVSPAAVRAGGRWLRAGEYEGERAGPVTVNEGLGLDVVPARSVYNRICLLGVPQEDGQRLSGSGAL